MTHRLPPLNALRAFEAAARHLSFNKAALELHVTQAAISHQIKALEHYLEVQLFRRLNRSLQLTEEAQVCLPKLREGFDCLAEAVEDVRAQNKRGRLTVSVAPSFAAKWLVPRLHRFAAAHPDIDMWISASMELIDKQNPHNMKPLDFRKGNVDVAIRFGWGKYPGFRADKLLEVSMIPMGSTLRVEPIGSRFSPRFGPRSAAHQRGSTRLAGPNFVCPASRVNRDPLGGDYTE